MTESTYTIGLVGLGVMGRNLALNIADHDVAVFGSDADEEKVQAFLKEGEGKAVAASINLFDAVVNLESPRAILLLVPAGDAVDAVIDELVPRLQPNDLIIDGGNSHYSDTHRRCEQLAGQNIAFLGMGISGGEKGARHGPSLMPGGSREAYERVQPILEAVAAKVDGESCVAYLGPGSAGHFVKMVHNGIEYGVMQLLAESYDLMKRSGMSNEEMGAAFAEWNQGELNSFLVEITARIFQKADDETGLPLLDLISDVARGKGTGKWTSQAGMDLQAPIPTIDMAVTMRDLSTYAEARQQVTEQWPAAESERPQDRRQFLDSLRNALYAATILTYDQGLFLLQRASATYGYEIDFEVLARIWRGGCIVRAALLESIRMAYRRQPDLQSLLLDPDLGKVVAENHADLRSVICQAAQLSVPVGGLMTALTYYDALRAQRLPTNLVQAQRDCFGAHTYERLDKPGTFHTEW